MIHRSLLLLFVKFFYGKRDLWCLSDVRNHSVQLLILGFLSYTWLNDGRCHLLKFMFQGLSYWDELSVGNYFLVHSQEDGHPTLDFQNNVVIVMVSDKLSQARSFSCSLFRKLIDINFRFEPSVI